MAADNDTSSSVFVRSGRRIEEAKFRPVGRPYSVSGDGRWLAVGPHADLSLIDVYDLKTGELTTTVRREGENPTADFRYRGVQFSSDGAQLVSASFDGRSITGIDRYTRRPICYFVCSDLTAFALSPNGRMIAIAQGVPKSKIEIRLWPSGDLVCQTEIEIETIRSIQFSSDNQHIITAQGRGCATWQIAENVIHVTSKWSAEDVNPFLPVQWTDRIDLVTNTYYGKTEVLRSVDGDKRLVVEEAGARALFSTGKDLALAGQDDPGVIKIIQIESGKVRARLRGHTDILRGLLVSRDESTLVGWSDSQIWVWDLQSLELRDYCHGANKIESLIFSPDGKTIASNCGSISVGDRRTLIGGVIKQHLQCLGGVHFWETSSGKRIHSASQWKCGGYSEDGRNIWLWNHEGQIQKVRLPTFETAETMRLRINNDGLHLSKDAETSGEEIDLIKFLPNPKHEDECQAAIYVRKSSIVTEMAIFGSFWNKTLKPAGAWNFEQMLFSLDGTAAACIHAPWENAGRRPSQQIGVFVKSQVDRPSWIQLEDFDFGDVAISAEGDSVLAVCHKKYDLTRADDFVGMWSTSSGKLLRRWDLNRPDLGPLESFDDRRSNNVAALSVDGDWFAVQGRIGEVEIWRATHEDASPFVTLKGHSAGITAITFSPDGKQLASGADDSAIMIYDLESVLTK